MAANKSRPARSLRRGSDFQELRTKGRKLVVKPGYIVIYKPNDIGYLRYGFSIPRQVGPAVLRNRLRRWSRELIRARIQEGKDWPVDVHFIFRPLPADQRKSITFKSLQDGIPWERLRLD